MPPLALTDRQLQLLQRAALAVPVNKRDEFLRGVARHLTSEASDDAVEAAINAMLDLVPAK